MAYGCASAGAARLAAVVTVLLASPAMADDEEAEERSPWSSVLFGSLEAGPTKGFVSAGMKTALWSGLSSSGFRTMLKIGGAQEQAQRQRPHGLAFKSEAQALVGYEWRIGDSFLSLYAGSDYEGEQREAPQGTVTTARYGARLHGDVWMTPLEGMMLQASAYASTLDGRLWGRIAPGWRVPQALHLGGFDLRGVHFGPEIEAYRGRDYHKLRLGLHLTGLRLQGLTWRVSGGWQRTSDHPSQAYATLGLHWQR